MKCCLNTEGGGCDRKQTGDDDPETGRREEFCCRSRGTTPEAFEPGSAARRLSYRRGEPYRWHRASTRGDARRDGKSQETRVSPLRASVQPPVPSWSARVGDAQAFE